MILPSCTTVFNPGQRKVNDFLSRSVIGDILSIHYHTGQYLPDWHPWETIDDYYVSKRDTGGGREIVPFELTWMNAFWGNPDVLSCKRGKLSDFNADIDDFYHAVLMYPKDIVCTLTVDVISRPKCVRELRLIGSTGILEWSNDRQEIRYCTVEHPEWISESLEVGHIEPMYINSETPYIEELKTFIQAVNSGNPSLFPNTLKKDYEVLSVLLKMEEK
jgi:predicted dehydrogenase